MKPVKNTLGENIAPQIEAAATAAFLDPVHLLALIRAESGLNPRAERWGQHTQDAKDAIESGNLEALPAIIEAAWPDISFGYSQRIVLFHDDGNRTKSVNNVLFVRASVFADPERDLQAAARRYAGCFNHPTCDGTPLSAMVVYNAGSDRRSEAGWMRQWAGNVASYQSALAWAEGFRDGEDGTVNKATIKAMLDVVWGWSEKFGAASAAQAEKELKDAVVAIKREVGLE